MLSVLTLVVQILVGGPQLAHAQEHDASSAVHVDEDESRTTVPVDLGLVPTTEAAEDRPESRPWYQRGWVWALFGGAIVTTVLLSVALAVALTPNEATGAERFCGEMGCIELDLDLNSE